MFGICGSLQSSSIRISRINISLTGTKTIASIMKIPDSQQSRKICRSKRYDVWRTHFDEVKKVIIEFIGSMMLDCIWEERSRRHWCYGGKFTWWWVILIVLTLLTEHLTLIHVLRKQLWDLCFFSMQQQVKIKRANVFIGRRRHT